MDPDLHNYKASPKAIGICPLRNRYNSSILKEKKKINLAERKESSFHDLTQPQTCRLEASLWVTWEAPVHSPLPPYLLYPMHAPRWLLVAPQLLQGPAQMTLSQGHPDHSVFVATPLFPPQQLAPPNMLWDICTGHIMLCVPHEDVRFLEECHHVPGMPHTSTK